MCLCVQFKNHIYNRLQATNKGCSGRGKIFDDIVHRSTSAPTTMKIGASINLLPVQYAQNATMVNSLFYVNPRVVEDTPYVLVCVPVR